MDGGQTNKPGSANLIPLWNAINMPL